MASFIPKAGNLEVVRPRVYWFPQRNVKCQQLRHFPEGRARGQRNAFLLFFTMCAKAEKLELFGTHPFFSAQEAGGKPCLAARWNHPEFRRRRGWVRPGHLDFQKRPGDSKVQAGLSSPGQTSAGQTTPLRLRFMPPDFPRVPHSRFLRPVPWELSRSRSAFRPHTAPRRPALRTPETSAREHPPRRWDLRGRQVCRAGRAGRARRSGRGRQRRGAGREPPPGRPDREVGEQLRPRPLAAALGAGPGGGGPGGAAGGSAGKRAARSAAQKVAWGSPWGAPCGPRAGRSGRAGARGRPESPPRGDRGTVAPAGPRPRRAQGRHPKSANPAAATRGNAWA